MTVKGTKKKAVAAIAAVSALSMMLSACGGSGDEAAQQLDKDGKPLVKVMFQSASNQTIATMGTWINGLQEACGCTIEWSEVQDSQWTQQKAATLAGGNPADVSIRAYHPSDAQKYPFFEDLSQHLDQMPNVQAFFKEQPIAKGMVTTPDGKMYTLPRYSGKLQRASGQHLFINKTWLDKLGLQVPKTWDELFKVMEAFKTQDPNGNGKADEIPYAMRNIGTSEIGWWSPFLFLNSTGISTQFNNSPSRFGAYIKDGKVQNYLVSDEYRDVIEFLHTMIEKGYSPKDSLTQQSSKYYASLQGADDNKTATVGLAITNIPSSFGTGLQDQYEAIPWPASKAGVTAVADHSQDEGAFEDYAVAVREGAPNMDTILKLINAMYGEDLSVQQRYGTFGDWVTKDGDHTYTVNEKFFKLTANEKSPAFADRFAGWISDEWTIKGDTSNEDLQKADAIYADQLKAVGDDYFPISLVPSDEDSTTLSNNSATYLSAALPKVADWMQNGGLDDASWKAYVDSLQPLGLDQNNQIWQKWLDEAKKK